MSLRGEVLRDEAISNFARGLLRQAEAFLAMTFTFLLWAEPKPVCKPLRHSIMPNGGNHALYKPAF